MQIWHGFPQLNSHQDDMQPRCYAHFTRAHHFIVKSAVIFSRPSRFRLVANHALLREWHSFGAFTQGWRLCLTPTLG